MPFTGTEGAAVDEGIGLLELREISLEFSPEGVRRVACFFLHYAARLESGEWRGGRVSLDEFDAGWPGDHPEADVIILNPDPEPPISTGDNTSLSNIKSHSRAMGVRMAELMPYWSP